MMMDDEKFFAWLDGELDPADAAEVGAIVAADPALSARASAHNAMQSRLAAAFAPVADAPVPDSLRGPARPTADVVDLASVRDRRRHRLSGVVQWGAMAATLAVGLFAGTMIGGLPQPSAPTGTVAASSPLGHALDTQLAGDPVQAGIRIGLSFRDRSGAYCRTFTDPSSQGLACTQDGRWLVRALFPSGEGQAGDIRMAAGPDPAVAAVVDRVIDGDAFDAAQEKAARDAGWR